MVTFFDYFFEVCVSFWSYIVSNWILSFFAILGIISLIVSLVKATQGRQ